MSANGPKLVFNANDQKYISTQLHQHPPTPDARFDHVHIDIVGPLPLVKGHSYLLTCVDRFTRWPEAIPLTNISAETVAQAFVLGWIARFGVPSTITTDRGAQFESALWRQLMNLLGSHQIRTSAYHPCANGLVECLHPQLKVGLMTHLPQVQWMDSLPLVLLGIRTALKEDLNCTASELVYGTTLRLPGEFFSTSQDIDTVDLLAYVSRLQCTMQQLRAIPPHHHSQKKAHVSPALHSCTHVFVCRDAICRSLQHPYDGPFKVLKRSDKYYTVSVKGQQQTISFDRLKPAHLDVLLPASDQLQFTSPTPPETTSSESPL